MCCYVLFLLPIEMKWMRCNGLVMGHTCALKAGTKLATTPAKQHSRKKKHETTWRFGSATFEFKMSMRILDCHHCSSFQKAVAVGKAKSKFIKANRNRSTTPLAVTAIKTNMPKMHTELHLLGMRFKRYNKNVYLTHLAEYCFHCFVKPLH